MPKDQSITAPSPPVDASWRRVGENATPCTARGGPQRPHELRLLLRGLAREFEQIIDALGGPAVALGEGRHSLMICAAAPVLADA